MDVETRTEPGYDRRAFIKRSAAVGAVTVWAAPTVQSMVAPAFAVGTAAGGCTARMTGGGNSANAGISGGSYNGNPASLTFGLGQLLCTPPPPGTTDTQIQVNAHPDDSSATGDRTSWHFTVATISCRTEEPNPSPGPITAKCPNVFEGTAYDRDDPDITLKFAFEDHGEGGADGDLDYASISITGGLDTVFGAGTLSRGNLQVHHNVPKVQRDCSGC